MVINRPRNIVVHHSLVSYNKNPNQFQAIDRYHKGKGWGMIGYQYLIEKDGTVITGRAEKQVGAHTSQNMMNYRSIGICLSGNFDKEEPTTEQKASLLKLIRDLQKKYRIADKNIFPHRHFAKYKSCWGSKLPNDIFGYLESTHEEKAPEWAKEALEWASKENIMSNERSNEQVTRAEIAVIMNRLYNLIK